MDLNLSSLSTQCAASKSPFQEGDRVVSILGRDAQGSVVRVDLLESAEGFFEALPVVYCRWTQVFKPKQAEANAERMLKLTAENLFLTLCDPASIQDPGNAHLIQFLSLMLERKKLLRPKGRTEDGERLIYEHAGTKNRYEVPGGEFTPAFFVQVQKQLGVLVGEPTQPSPAQSASVESSVTTA